MTAKEEIKLYKRVINRKDEMDYSQWKENKIQEVKKMSREQLCTRMRECETEIRKIKFFGEKDDVEKFHSNIESLIIVLITATVTILIGLGSGLVSALSLLGKGYEELKDIKEFVEVYRETISILYLDIEKGILYIAMVVVILFVGLTVYRIACKNRTFWKREYYYDMLKILSEIKKDKEENYS